MKPEMWSLIIIIGAIVSCSILLAASRVMEEYRWYKALRCYMLLSLAVTIVSGVILWCHESIDILQPLEMTLITTVIVGGLCSFHLMWTLWDIRMAQEASQSGQIAHQHSSLEPSQSDRSACLALSG